jgi:hypothetical protein
MYTHDAYSKYVPMYVNWTQEIFKNSNSVFLWMTLHRETLILSLPRTTH